MLTDSPKTETLDVPLVVRVSPSMLQRIKAIAKRERRSQSQWTRMALEDAIAAQGEKETADA